MNPDKEKIENLEARPPVVAILGHIDHGKSTLIDYIRKSNVVSREAGGITQHASAYEISRTTKEGKESKMTILDTPGHEAFENVRSRSAAAADIAGLIVSAEDGVKPQTLEVLSRIKEIGLPYLVIITKIDKPSADVARAKQSLAENGIFVEGYGGNTPVVELSAKTGQGVDDFLDMVSLMAELEGKTGERDALGSGVIIESKRDPKRGITATGIIKNGTVRKGLFAAARGSFAPLRFILDFEGNMVDELSFSSPVQIVGWDDMPPVGEEFKTFLKKDEAAEYAATSAEAAQKTLGSKNTIANKEGAASLPVIIKADTAGSLEAVIGELNKLSKERIAPKIISSGVGSISENDVKSALTTPGTIIFGFNVKTDSQATALAERSGIIINVFNIIYELTDKVSALLDENEPRIEVEEIESSVKILKVFSSSKGKQVIGGRVLSGTFKKGAAVKIVRRDSELGQGKIKELQQAKVAADSASEGTEFGAMIEAKIDVAPGDILNAVITVVK